MRRGIKKIKTAQAFLFGRGIKREKKKEGITENQQFMNAVHMISCGIK